MLSRALHAGVAMIAVLALLAGCAHSGPDYSPYDDKADAGAAIAGLLANKESARRILLVFGANWCSDSRALEQRMQEPRLAQLLAREFRVLHIDVGMSNRNLDITRRYGNPIDKGIPSVVLLSPSGDRLYTDHGSLSSAGDMTALAVQAFFERLVAHPAP
jgi:thioredoxin 1